MDPWTASEMAYNSGYEKGFKDGERKGKEIAEVCKNNIEVFLLALKDMIGEEEED